MAKLWAVIKREYIERVRTKWFIIVTLFGPIFFAVIMILPGYLSVKGMREARVSSLRIVDATGIGLGERVAMRLAVPQLAAGGVFCLQPEGLEEGNPRSPPCRGKPGHFFFTNCQFSSNRPASTTSNAAGSSFVGFGLRTAQSPSRG